MRRGKVSNKRGLAVMVDGELLLIEPDKKWFRLLQRFVRWLGLPGVLLPFYQINFDLLRRLERYEFTNVAIALIGSYSWRAGLSDRLHSRVPYQISEFMTYSAWRAYIESTHHIAKGYVKDTMQCSEMIRPITDCQFSDKEFSSGYR